jgi:hypothetical protein
MDRYGGDTRATSATCCAGICVCPTKYSGTCSVNEDIPGADLASHADARRHGLPDPRPFQVSGSGQVAAMAAKTWRDFGAMFALAAISLPLPTSSARCSVVFALALGWLLPEGRITFPHLILSRTHAGCSSCGRHCAPHAREHGGDTGNGFCAHRTGKGFESTVVYRHALRIALLPVIPRPACSPSADGIHRRRTIFNIPGAGKSFFGALDPGPRMVSRLAEW